MAFASEALGPMAEKLASRALLGAAQYQALIALPHRIVEAGRDRYFAREGDRSTHCCILLSGYAMCHKMTGDGARQVVAIHVPGDLLDVQNGAADFSASNAQSLSPVQVAIISREALLGLALEHPAIAMALWADTGANASILAEWLLNVGRRDARTRIAHLICEVHFRQEAVGQPSPKRTRWFMTQEQIGDATCLTPIHVNRTLQGLRRDGFLGNGPRSLAIADWQGLCVVGDFTPDYLQLSGRDRLASL